MQRSSPPPVQSLRRTVVISERPFAHLDERSPSRHWHQALLDQGLLVELERPRGQPRSPVHLRLDVQAALSSLEQSEQAFAEARWTLLSAKEALVSRSFALTLDDRILLGQPERARLVALRDAEPPGSSRRSELAATVTQLDQRGADLAADPPETWVELDPIAPQEGP